ncbi:DNA repair exonuclease [Psychrobacillus sp. FSL W7-1457]|uniref:metallophosphoesterase family protein n=1 Tax=unclassified Psychrobacillus TaxID=2636677 RepID=UPI0030FBD39C
MAAIRFLHVADLHLDSPFKGLSSIPKNRWQEIRESTFHAFENIIQYAVTAKPDFVLIAGDIYDGENRSLRAQHLFQRGMEALREVGIPVFICHGNHDHLSGSWVRFQLPENVQVFGQDVETKTIAVQGNQVHISGFSYKERHIREAMHSYYPNASGQDYHIGMLHGSVEGDKEHDVYAPFRQSDLIGKGYDYWALGHIHKRQVLHMDPAIVYPGNIQSRHRNERGKKGFYEVTLSKDKTDLQFVPCSMFIYDQLEVSCKNIIHANELITLVEQGLKDYVEQNGNAIVELTLSDISEETFEMLDASSREEWLAIFQESLDKHNPFILLKDLTINLPASQLNEALILSEIWEGWDSAEWKLAVKELYQHPKGSRYLPSIDEHFIEEVKEESKQLLNKAVSRGV